MSPLAYLTSLRIEKSQELLLTTQKTIAKIAEESGFLSNEVFIRTFKKETGMSFVAWLTNVRMDEAVKLLSTTEDKTYEISLKVGYTEPNYFSYVFKKQFGMSPTKYRGSRDAVHA